MAREIVLRPAEMPDADEIAQVMRASRSSLEWLPVVHTADEDRAFVRDHMLPNQDVTVAMAGNAVIGFIAVSGEWIEQLYLKPGWTGRGIGKRLLDHTTSGMPVTRLYCFQANEGARCFYERHGFRAEFFGSGDMNEEKLPDILYVRHASER